MPLAHVRRGSGPPLVLIHGIGSQWQMWEPVLDRLSARARSRRRRPARLRRLRRATGAADRRGAGGRGRVSSSTEIGLAGRARRGQLARRRRRARDGARRARARSACVLSPAGFGNMREGRYARAVLVNSRRVGPAPRRRAPSSSLRGPVRRTLAFGHLVARPVARPARRGRRRDAQPCPLARLRGARSRRSRTIASAATRSTARSPSPGERRTGCCSTRARAPARRGCSPTPATSRSTAAATSRPGTTRSRSRGCCWRASAG